jgi:peptide/nickel transport system substrate-binding protein
MIRLGQTGKAFEMLSVLAVALLALVAGSRIEPAAMAQTIGGSMIGKLEGPEVITNPAQFPKTFQESPQLAELVKAGKLPPVAERLGQDPLVIKPVHEIGRYGGTWRRGFTGPADKFNGYRTLGHDNLLYWDYTGSKVVPNIARGWEFADDGRTFTLYLRRGMKWSDGHPFTADDFIFWYEDIYNNKDLVPTKAVQMTMNSEPVVIEKVDTYTVRLRSPAPYYLLPDVLAGQNAIAGHAQGGLSAMGLYAPAHYLKQFHPNYVAKEALDKKVKEAQVDNWVNLFKFKNDWTLNPELPVVTAWKTTSPINTPTWVLERNPYSIWVDTAGNQLPYIDKVVMTLAENLEVLNLRAIAGEYDFQERHVDLGKLPVFLENQQRGNYKVSLDPSNHGTDTGLRFNQSYNADPEIARWLTNRDFRIALSLGIERDQLNETFWLGIGTPGSYVVAEASPYNPGPEYRTLHHTYDPKTANALLNKIGLEKKDAEGYRLRTDGKGRLRLELMTQSGVFFPFTQIAEMIKEQWKKIGIQVDVVEVERSLNTRRIEANEHQIDLRAADGTEHMFAHHPGAIFPSGGGLDSMGPLYGKWFASGGTQGKEPPPRMRELMDKYRRAFAVPESERNELAREVWQIACDEVWTIGTVGLSPAIVGVRVVKTTMGNIPERLYNSASHKSPGPARPEQFYFRQ